MSESTFILKLGTLLEDLREIQATSTKLANNLEATILKLFEEEELAAGAMPVKQPEFKINQQILDLIKGEPVKFNMSAKNIADLRDYAFIEVHANTGSTVQFTYFTASTYTRQCFMHNMLPEVNQVLQEGGIYVVHNQKRKGKNFWDMAVACEGEPHQIQARAKKLAKLFAELKNEGKL
jgi:hypothetical protein